jgi:transposase
VAENPGRPPRRAGARGEDQAIGRSKGGLSTKIHTLVDALGNPIGFFLTPRQAHDLQGADALLPEKKAHTQLADKAIDADQSVIKPLEAAGKTCVRAIATRYDKTAVNFLAAIHLAAAIAWLN